MNSAPATAGAFCMELRAGSQVSQTVDLIKTLGYPNTTGWQRGFPLRFEPAIHECMRGIPKPLILKAQVFLTSTVFNQTTNDSQLPISAEISATSSPEMGVDQSSILPPVTANKAHTAAQSHPPIFAGGCGYRQGLTGFFAVLLQAAL